MSTEKLSDRTLHVKRFLNLRDAVLILIAQTLVDS